MKSSLYFEIKLKKRALLHKLNKLHRQITKKTQNKNKKNIKQSKNLKKQNKKKMLSQILKQKFSMSKIIVPGNDDKNLIARKYTGVIM